MDNDSKWILPENLRAQEEREIRKGERGQIDGSNDFGAYYAFSKGIDLNLIKSHAISEDEEALDYARNLQHFLSFHDFALKGNILDVGCAIGTITDAFRRLVPGARLYGLEISRLAIEAAKNRYPECRFFCQSSDSLDNFEDHFFDVIHAREFYPFTRTDDWEYQIGYLCRFADKLKPRGLLIFQMRDSIRGLHNAFAKLRAQIESVGYRNAQEHDMIPIKLSKLVGRRLSWKALYRACSFAASIAYLVASTRRGRFYVFRKN